MKTSSALLDQLVGQLWGKAQLGRDSPDGGAFRIAEISIGTGDIDQTVTFPINP